MIEPVYHRDGVQIFCGDCRAVLPTLEAGSVNCCVTSPPYFGLRDYGHGDQIGLEESVGDYVNKMVEVFREVRRVLANDGTLWLNLGDSYNAYNANRGPAKGANKNHHECMPAADRGLTSKSEKSKDLLGIPWLVAFALRNDGWYLRQDIIWSKPNPMPESVTDRCTKAHEYIFLLSKSARYHCNMEAIQEAAVWAEDSRAGKGRKTYNGKRQGGNGEGQEAFVSIDEARNKRSVWTVTTQPYKGAHFAVFPKELITPCIKAGCPEGGTVLDPFNGSGTTMEVARQLCCKAIGIELNPEYIKLAKKRLRQGLLI